MSACMPDPATGVIVWIARTAGSLARTRAFHFGQMLSVSPVYAGQAWAPSALRCSSPACHTHCRAPHAAFGGRRSQKDRSIEVSARTHSRSAGKQAVAAPSHRMRFLGRKLKPCVRLMSAHVLTHLPQRWRPDDPVWNLPDLDIAKPVSNRKISGSLRDLGLRKTSADCVLPTLSVRPRRRIYNKSLWRPTRSTPSWRLAY